jgi:hypothetical protein
LHALPAHGQPSVDDVAQDLVAAIDGIRVNLPDVTGITLMPPVGGDCPGVGLAEVNPTVAAAIDAVAGGDVSIGPNVIVQDCSMFSDSAGHLTTAASAWVAEQVAAWFGTADSAPVADAGIDQTVQLADGATTVDVTLDASASTDDGTIVEYTWSENSSDIATGATPTVPFTEGTHTVTLTVTDDMANTDTDTVQITVSPPSSGLVYIGDLDGLGTRVGKPWVAVVTVTVLSDGQPVAGATVAGMWAGGTGATSCVTDGAGQCTVTSDEQGRQTEALEFTVTDVGAGGVVYDPAANTDPDGDSDGTTITVLRP